MRCDSAGGTETTSDKEWDRIIVIHDNHDVKTTWSFHRCTMGELIIMPEKLLEKQLQDFHLDSELRLLDSLEKLCYYKLLVG